MRTRGNHGFLDTLDKFKGWKSVFETANAWVKYNIVDFGTKKYGKITVKAASENGGTLQIRAKAINGPVIAEVKIPKNNGWKEIKVPVLKFEPGIQDLFIVTKNNNPVEVDWIRFE